jgi:hypothetical protein
MKNGPRCGEPENPQKLKPYWIRISEGRNENGLAYVLPSTFGLRISAFDLLTWHPWPPNPSPSPAPSRSKTTLTSSWLMAVGAS